MMLKKTMVLGICLLPLLVTGCGKIPELENGQEVVAEMDGKEITVDALYEKMKNNFARDVLITMIDRSILEEKYETTDDMDAQINAQIETLKNQMGDSFLATIKSQAGLNSEAELYDYFELSLKRTEAVEDYVKTIITEKEIEEYYDNETTGDIKASHILIKPETTDGMSDEEISTKEQEALNLANEIISKLNDGDDFAELAKEYSDDEGSATNGGDLGWFNKGVMDPAFEQEAFVLEKGKYSTAPIESAYGYHIILKVDTKEKPTLDDARESIIESLVEDKIAADQTLSFKGLEQLRKDNKLVIHDSELKKQYDAYMKELSK